MTLYDIPVNTLHGEPSTLAEFRGKALLVVNVASKCGLTPQYEGLERLQKTYGDKGFSVLGFPCNQFGAQEPGTAAEIQSFCSLTYGVTFPLSAKIDVNGAHRHALYAWLTAKENGFPGDIGWNFEKFLIDRDGRVVCRYPSGTKPTDPTFLQDLADVL
jgi:glutathione peroxidase